ncbi:macrolide transport system ATP-binding/permease protein [Croceifilum oryzae]|uniref:Macrolide transport system ATP-binding/permease protein n=1 Tax=Croceifilum oryzae TaxID=1553429 RepID=A0AAJ1WUU7_9BACL|nr:ABC-F family ATP-binding cassette domain-containing protein [Croceifilum oryzae]MDQ0418331.1 macrolide transport system ATP-binding/permease protein [Croceifilum oryzae]
MFILEMNHVKKWFGNRLLFSIDKLQVEYGEKIGIVGRNGTGKTTLLRMLSHEEDINEGILRVKGTVAWIKQEEDENGSSLSGGEETKRRITHALSQQPSLLLADEPTSHLDAQGVQWLEKEFVNYPGTLLIVSHDRALLNTICTQILEIDGEKIHIYNGNYQSYLEQKELATNRMQFEYQQVENEKKRLLDAARKKKLQAERMGKTPTRMSTSESRLYKAGKGAQIAKVAKQVKAFESRIEKVGKVEKPTEIKPVPLDLHYHHPLESKISLRLENVSKTIGDRALFQELTCSIPTGAKVAVIGKNGAGKSTLLDMIVNQESGVKLSPQAKMGYFHQKTQNLKRNQTILENVSEQSRYTKSMIRTILARLSFPGDTIWQRVSSLSGGEKQRVQLAKIFLSDANFLVLDEPTNFLDISTREELEKVLVSHPGTILFSSHDRQLLSSVATFLIILEEGIATCFNGTYDEYLEKKKGSFSSEQNPDQLLLQYELTEVISRLSLSLKEEEKEALEKRYHEIRELLKL